MEKNFTTPRRLKFKGSLYGERYYSCPHCNYSIREDELGNIGEGDKENTYHCPDCFRIFFYKR
jgi:DNA-directed RNA polymerase subunit RPC12/RpoP